MIVKQMEEVFGKIGDVNSPNPQPLPSKEGE